eukprot:6210378-Pleurochrysis_carterae.AAC.3
MTVCNAKMNLMQHCPCAAGTAEPSSKSLTARFVLQQHALNCREVRQRRARLRGVAAGDGDGETEERARAVDPQHGDPRDDRIRQLIGMDIREDGRSS